MKVLSVSEKRLDAVRKIHIKPIENYDNGTNVHFAFRLMLWTFTCLLLTLQLIILRTIQDFQFEYNWLIIISIAVVVSLAFNYTTLWRSDRYENYFRTFKQETRTRKDYLLAAIYHMTITIACFLTVMTT